MDPDITVVDDLGLRHLVRTHQVPVLVTLAVLLATQVITVTAFGALSAASTLIGAFTSTPKLAAITQLVPTERMASANGTYQARMYAAVLVGPIIGGVLLGVSAVVLYTVVAAASAISALLLALLNDSLTVSERASEGSFARDFAIGWRFLFAERSVRGMLFIQFWSNVAVSSTLFLTVMSLRQSGHSTAEIGIVQTAIGGGGLLGALLVTVVTRHVGFSVLQVGAKTVLVAGLVLAIALEGRLVMVLPLGAALILSPSAGASVFARVTQITPPEDGR